MGRVDLCVSNRGGVGPRRSRAQHLGYLQPRRCAILDHSTAAIATDSYHRFPDDVALVAGAGLNAYRFSIAWPRIQAIGSGPANPKGLDFYSRLVDAQLAAGLEPYATLFHWDMPQPLQDRGGWLNRDTSARFADYAAIVADHLGDRMKNFITINEAAVHAFLGHVLGTHAPGLKGANNLGPVIHHQNLAQGLAIQALRAARTDLRIGASFALTPTRPSGGALWNRLVSGRLGELWNGASLDPLLKGSYPKSTLVFMSKVLKDNDLKITRQPIDFVGVNYYSPAYIGFDLASKTHISPGSRHREPSSTLSGAKSTHRVFRRFSAGFATTTEIPT